MEAGRLDDARLAAGRLAAGRLAAGRLDEPFFFEAGILFLNRDYLTEFYFVLYSLNKKIKNIFGSIHRFKN